MAPNLEQICEVLDKLTLDSLTLMEQHIQNKMDLEVAMVDGESDLAKARYIMGHSSVSRLQLPLPSDDGVNDFDAAAVVNRADDTLDLEVQSEVGVQNPLKWFGILVPQNLHRARDHFKRALHRTVQTANTQIQLEKTLVAVAQLTALKEELKLEE